MVMFEIIKEEELIEDNDEDAISGRGERCQLK